MPLHLPEGTLPLAKTLLRVPLEPLGPPHEGLLRECVHALNALQLLEEDTLGSDEETYALSAEGQRVLASPHLAESWPVAQKALLEQLQVYCAHRAEGRGDENTELLERLIQLCLEAGSVDAAEDYACRLVQAAAATEDREAMALGHYQHGRILGMRGEWGLAQDAYEKALKLYTQLDDARGRGNVLRGLGSVLINEGHYDRAERVLEESNAEFRRCGDVEGTAKNAANLAVIYEMHGEVAAAEAKSREALACFLRLGDEGAALRVQNNIGILQAAQERYEEAVALFRDVARLAERRGDAQTKNYAIVNEAYCLAKLGNLDRAKALSETAMGYYKGPQDQNLLALVWRNLGIICAAALQLDDAVAWLLKSLQLARSGGAADTEASCHFEYGLVLRRLRNYRRAKAELLTAAKLYEDVGNLHLAQQARAHARAA